VIASNDFRRHAAMERYA